MKVFAESYAVYLDEYLDEVHDEESENDTDRGLTKSTGVEYTIRRSVKRRSASSEGVHQPKECIKRRSASAEEMYGSIRRMQRNGDTVGS